MPMRIPRTPAALYGIALMVGVALGSAAPGFGAERVELPGVIPLWAGSAPGSDNATQEESRKLSPDGKFTAVRNITRPTLTVYLPRGATRLSSAVLIAPGGAFRFLNIDTEGEQVADWLCARGMAAFVLKYRVVKTSPDDAQMWRELGMQLANPAPLLAGLGEDGRLGMDDARQALRLIRERAKQWHVDRDRLGVLGFSAGGMIASRLLLQSEPADAPAFVGVMYAAPFGEFPARNNLPPTFLAWAADDALVGSYAQRFYEQLRAANLRPELHVYDRGGHGFGMRRQGSSSDFWIEDFYHWLQTHGFADEPAAGRH
jgi:acetyl esterase/lipase